VAPQRYKYGFLVVDVWATNIRGASRTRELGMFASRFGDGFDNEEDRFDTRVFHSYRLCGGSPRLRMPLRAAATEEVHLNLPTASFVSSACRMVTSLYEMEE